MAQKLKPYAKRAADYGGKISFEIHDDTIHDCAPSALRLLKLIDEPNVGLNPDTLDQGWLYPGEDLPSPIEQAKMVAPYVIYWDVKPCVPAEQPDGEIRLNFIHVDEATIPIHVFAQIFVAAGYDGVAMLELYRGADVGYAMKRFSTYMTWLRDEYIPNVPLP